MLDHDCFEEVCGAPLAMNAYTKRTKVGRYKVDDGSCLVPVCANGHRELTLEAASEYERRATIAVLREAAEIKGGRDPLRSSGDRAYAVGTRQTARCSTGNCVSLGEWT